MLHDETALDDEPALYDDEPALGSDGGEANPFHEVPAAPATSSARNPGRVVDGEEFLFGEAAETVAVWGTPHAPLWAAGEALMIAGPDGVGKTTLLQQLALARLGIRDQFLGYTVVPDERPVLYLALDRHHQIKRSLRRMVGDDDRTLLRERLRVWQGPLASDLARDEFLLLGLVEEFGAGTLFLDSVKDAALSLTDDTVAGTVNRAIQHVVASGVEFAGSHHQRKSTGDNKRPNKLADVYGSRWITAGMGSVLMLWGEAGDIVVELTHLKQPLEPVGPLTLIHDHEHGHTTVEARPAIEDLVTATRRSGLTCADAARQLFGAEDRNAVERARRALEKLAARDGYERRDDEDGVAHYFKTTLEAA